MGSSCSTGQALPQEPNMYRKYSAEMSSVGEYEVDVADLTPGRMKEAEVGDSKLLLVNDSGIIRALSAKCTHYGAPLVNGVFGSGHVRCPWHGACFNVKTGDIEDFPGMDCLQTFEVVPGSGGKVKVKATEEQLKVSKRVRASVSSACGQHQTVLIIGGGPSAAVCADTLRQEGFSGSIVVATKEKHLPYDRPKLSKAVNVTPDQIALRSKDHYDQLKIEWKFEKEVVKVESGDKKVKFKDGEELKYDKLVLATGAVPRILTSIPGHDLENVVSLRSVNDAAVIGEKSAGKNVVILGTSFIGIELAAALCSKAASVHLVDMVEVPFQLALGSALGGIVERLLAEKGVKFHFKNSIKQFEADGRKAVGALLTDGSKLPLDLCIMGVGVVPATDFLQNSGIMLNDRGFVIVDKTMKTSNEHVYAVGDITAFPLFIQNNESVNIQHWQMAKQQGRIAALNLAGKVTEIKSVPFFWTMFCGKSIRYTGYGPGYDDIHIHGSLDEYKFVAFYFKGEQVVAVASLGMDPVAVQAAEYLLQQQTLTKKMIKEDPLGWISKIRPSA